MDRITNECWNSPGDSLRIRLLRVWEDCRIDLAPKLSRRDTKRVVRQQIQLFEFMAFSEELESTYRLAPAPCLPPS